MAKTDIFTYGRFLQAESECKAVVALT